MKIIYILYIYNKYIFYYIYTLMALAAFLKKYEKPSQLEIKKMREKEPDCIIKNEHEPLSHTIFGKFNKCYSIPLDKNEKLYELLYNSVFEKKEEITLAERPLENIDDNGNIIYIKPLYVDIDFNYNKENNIRKYNKKHLDEIYILYNKIIRKYLLIDSSNPIKCYFFEREKPYLDTNKNKSSKMKDGIHLIFPDIITNTKIQFLIRNDIIQEFHTIINNSEIGEIPIINTFDDVIDNSVIEKNGWLMYGCSKPGIQPYKLTYIYTSSYIEEEDEFSFYSHKKKKDTDKDLISLFSQRKIFKQESILNIKPEYEDLLKQELESKKKTKKKYELTEEEQKMLNLCGGGNSNFKTKKISDFDNALLIKEAEQLVELLSPIRSNEFHSWLEVGFCLFNISESLKNCWFNFSKKCAHKYKKEECEKWWNSFQKRDLNIASLHYWAKSDDIIGYSKFKSNSIHKYIAKAVNSLSDQDFCDILYTLYQYQYASCVNDKKEYEWYEFTNHRWVIDPKGTNLQQKIGKELQREFLNYISFISSKAKDNLINDDEELNNITDNIKKIYVAIDKLKAVSKKNSIMSEAASNHFYKPKFNQNLDTNPNLLCFNNGVYDLQNNIFRDGRPEDMISLSTNIDYPDYEYDEEHEEIAEVLDFFNKIFPDKDTRIHTLKFLGYVLSGTCELQQMCIFLGPQGSNGKSLLINLISQTLGDYAGTANITLLTQPRKDSSKPDPSLMSIIKNRFVSLNEATKDDKFNSGILKELTGADKVTGRGLFGQQETFTIFSKLCVLCNNLPKVDGNDPAIWRRIIIVPFKSHFVTNPNPNNKYEFKIDNTLPEKIKYWSGALILILIKYYKLYKEDGGLGIPQKDKNGNYIFDSNGKKILEIPKEILKETNDYKNDSNYYSQFIEERLEKDINSKLSIGDAFTNFKDFISVSSISIGKTSITEFRKEIVKTLMKDCFDNKYFKGWRIKVNKKENEENEENADIEDQEKLLV